MQSLSWYLNRLSRMSAREVIHRLRKDIVCRLERAGALGAHRPPKPALRRIAPWICLDTESDMTELEAEADRILANRQPIFRLAEGLGGTFPCWNRDPLTGIVAPMTFGKSLDYRSESLVGNIKYLWEPNRHLELVTLAQAYARTGENRFLDGVIARISSWLRQCPYPLGPNWSSSLESGIRLINWSIVWDLLEGLDSPLRTDASGNDLLDAWLKSVYQHVRFVDANYSKFSSANNHIVGEAAGVYIATCVWPFWPEFEQCRARAKEILLEESKRQTYADGVNKEQAISYQQFVFDFLLFAALAGERCQDDTFPLDYWLRIEAMVGFISSLLDVGGKVPMFGDADDGYVSRMAVGEFCPYRSMLATGAIRFERQEWAAQAGAIDGKTRSLMGDSASEAFDRILKSDGTRLSPTREFPDGGYYILGRGIQASNELKVVVDCGQLGYLSIAAHGHADALSFVLSVCGYEILVDPGTFSYHTEPKWREYFRGTGAHNTVRVDGLDQSVQGGNFMWLRHAKARCIGFDVDSNGGRFEGEHDGYMRLDDPVMHRRLIEQRETKIRVVDELSCKGHHRVEQCWHFSEQCRVRVTDEFEIVAKNGPVTVRLRAAEPMQKIHHLRGSEDPAGGWVSRRFDVKEPADSVYFVKEIEGTATLTTLIECEIDANQREKGQVYQN